MCLLEQFPQFFRRHRPPGEEALVFVAASFPQEGELVGVFHAFRKGAQPEVVRHPRDDVHDGRIVRLARAVADERAVDLEFVGRQALEVSEVRITGPEIVDGKPYPEPVEGAQLLDHVLGIVHRDALGDFKLELVSRQIRGTQDRCQARSQVRLAELTGGNVDGDPRRSASARILPAAAFGAGFPQYPVADRQDQSGLFRQRDEFCRCDCAELGAVPA